MNFRNTFKRNNQSDKDNNLKNNLSDNLNFLQKKLSEQVEVAKAKVENFSFDAKGKYTDSVNQAFEMIPMLEELGYQTEEFLVHIALPPAIELRLFYQELPSKEKLEQHKEKYADNKMFIRIIEALHTAGTFQAQLKPGTLKPSGIMIKLTIPPSITLVYLPDKKEAVVENQEKTQEE